MFSPHCRSEIAIHTSPHSFMDVSLFRIYVCPVFDFCVARIALNMERMAFLIIRFAFMQLMNYVKRKCVCVCGVVYIFII